VRPTSVRVSLPASAVRPAHTISLVSSPGGEVVGAGAAAAATAGTARHVVSQRRGGRWVGGRTAPGERTNAGTIGGPHAAVAARLLCSSAGMVRDENDDGDDDDARARWNRLVSRCRCAGMHTTRRLVGRKRRGACREGDERVNKRPILHFSTLPPGRDQDQRPNPTPPSPAAREQRLPGFTPTARRRPHHQAAAAAPSSSTTTTTLQS